MEVTTNIQQPAIDPAEALWTLFTEINARLDEVEKDIVAGNTIACEDVHRNIESKCPWL